MTLQRFKRNFLGKMKHSLEGKWVRHTEVKAFLDTYNESSKKAWTKKARIQISIEKNDLKEHYRKKLVVLIIATTLIVLTSFLLC